LEESDALKVEKLSENDAAEIEWLLKEVWPKATEYPRKWREARVISQRQIIGEMSAGLYYFGIRANGRIVGSYKASITGDAFIGEHQSVHPAYRRHGLAKAMYEHFIKFAKEIECKEVRVNVLPSQVASVKIVEKHGFVKIKECEQILGMLVHLYEKKIES